jgi:DNA polymerase III delta subunit
VVTTFTGENSFALGQAISQLTKGFVAKHGMFALQRIDGEEADFAMLQQALTSLSLLAPHQMIIVRSPGKNALFSEHLEQLSLEIPARTDVVIIEPKLDKRLQYYKYLKAHTDFREFPELDNNSLAHWLISEAKARNGSIDPGDARYLIERVGMNQQLLSNELDKLLLYDQHITRRSIDILTDSTPQSTIFDLLEAAFSGQAEKALTLYAQQRTLKIEPQQIIAMLGWQLRVLAVIKTAGDRPMARIAAEARISPFVIQKSQRIAQKLSITELKTLIANLLNIDTRLKSSLVNADEALQHYLLHLKT